MPSPIDIGRIQDSVLHIRGQRVLLDRTVANLYGVLTRDINKAVKNNPLKFPKGYIIQLTDKEKSELVENFHQPHGLQVILHDLIGPFNQLIQVVLLGMDVAPA